MRESGDFAEADDEPADRGHDRRSGECDRDGVQHVSVVVHEQRNRAQRGADRNAEQHPCRQRHAAGLLRPAGRECDNRRSDDPRCVVEAARLVAVVRDQDEVDAVGGGEQREATGEEPHASRRAPVVERQQCRDDQQQQDVEQRIGLRGDDRCGAVAVRVHGLEDRADDGCSDGGDRQASDDAIKPEAQRELAGEVADDQQQRDERARVERQPEAIGHGREGRFGQRPDEDRPVDVAQSVHREA